jgi:hypothetical protein
MRAKTKKREIVSAEELLFRLVPAALDVVADYEATKRTHAETMANARWESVRILLQTINDIEQWRRLTR